jgi:hypothetical protein
MSFGLLLSLLVAARSQYDGGIANQRATALGSFNNPEGLWAANPLASVFHAKEAGTSFQRGIGPQGEAGPAKLIKTAGFYLESADPQKALRELMQALTPLGASLVGSTQSQTDDGQFEISANLAVPAARFDDALRLINASGSYVYSVHTEVHDVSKDYVDSEATLNNYRAEEAQYLSIIKSAHSVHDTVEVSEHLADVRGRIERAQADFQLLSHQIEMSAISINISPQENTGPLHLRPIARLRRALHDSLSSLADYASAIVAALAYLPAALLWFCTVFAAVALGWKISRLLWKILFLGSKAA